MPLIFPWKICSDSGGGENPFFAAVQNIHRFTPNKTVEAGGKKMDNPTDRQTAKRAFFSAYTVRELWRKMRLGMFSAEKRNAKLYVGPTNNDERAVPAPVNPCPLRPAAGLIIR